MKQLGVVASLISHLVVVSTVAQEIGTTTTATGTGFDEEGCACRFDGKDPDDCILWGSLNGDLKAWPYADQTCLDAYDIVVVPPDASVICAFASSFVLGLRDLESTSYLRIKLALGVIYGGFWEESPTDPDIIVLKDSITIDGTTYDCVTSESDCYNAITHYFESDPNGMQEMETICTQLEKGELLAREFEQATLRVRICNEDREGVDVVPECSKMALKMESDLEALKDTMDCGGFATGIGGRIPPDCQGGGGEGDDSGSSLFYSSCSDMGLLTMLIMGATSWTLWQDLCGLSYGRFVLSSPQSSQSEVDLHRHS